MNIEARLQRLETAGGARAVPVEQSIAYQILKDRGTPEELAAFVKNYDRSNVSIADQITGAYEH